MVVSVRGILALAGGVAYHMILGCMYTYGAISLYLASYYRQYDPSVTTRFLITFLPLRGLITIFCLPYGAFLGKKFGPRFTTLIGGGTVLFCVFCLIFVKSKYLFLLFFSATFGVSAINYMPPIMCAWKYFPLNRGTVTGIVIGGFALGPLIFTFITKMIVNPSSLRTTIAVRDGDIVDYFYGPEVANNVPKMFLILCVIWGFMIMFTFFSLRDPEIVSLVDTSQISENMLEEESHHDSVLLSRNLTL